jgi:hypothetical protein
MLGFGSFAEFPFATVAPDTGVIINVNGNQLNITIGSVGIIAESIIENVDPKWINSWAWNFSYYWRC